MEIPAAQRAAPSLPPTGVRHVWCLPDTDLTQAADARRKATGVLEGWRLPRATVDDAVLVVCELVTNALRHGRSPVRIALHRGVHLGHGALTISVSDQGKIAYPSGPEEDLVHAGENGRGLSIVAALAQAHGYEGGSSTTFWARLPTRAADGL
ncbi:ATP-binding protein [Streptomyces sp. NBC_01716]|uniref:ATP-binding protein n=1 Tax=Streptomyces sp. NBC_01716 TaxID=2975917 RepID=UPI002E322EC4|nr:ATP-binding protein [Streptomyces sp. NBC_01716]